MRMATRIRKEKKKTPAALLKYLYSAFFEWMLIAILFVNAASSYLAGKFARFFKLRTPCLLCSRLDDSFQELLCHTHKSEISSLTLCSSHGKLVDGRIMCNGCHISFVDAMESDNMEEIVKLPLLNEEAMSSSSGSCTCCSLTLRRRQNPGGMSYESDCREIKIASDSDSEIMFNDAADGAKDQILHDAPTTICSRKIKRDVQDDVLSEKVIQPSPLVSEFAFAPAQIICLKTA